MVTTDLRSPPKVCRVTSPGVKGQPLGSPVRMQTRQPSGSTTSPGSTVVVSSATEEKGTPQTTQIECPPLPPPSGGTTASSQASTPSTQSIWMTDPPASPPQSLPSPSSLSPGKSESHDDSWGSVGDDVLLDATQKMEEDAASAVEVLNSSQLDRDTTSTPTGITKALAPGPAVSPISTEKAQIKQERQRSEFVSKEEEQLCALNVIPETEWTYQRSEEAQAEAEADSKSITKGGNGAAPSTSQAQSDSEPQGPSGDSDVTKGPAAEKERRLVQLGDHVIMHAFWAKITSLSPACVMYYCLKNASNPAAGWVLNTV